VVVVVVVVAAAAAVVVVGRESKVYRRKQTDFSLGLLAASQNRKSCMQ
jgi:hypothetical protein